MNKRILIVEDDELMVIVLSQLFEKLNYEICKTVTEGEEVLEAVKETSPDLITLDISLAGEMNGFDVAKQLYENGILTPIVFISAEINPERMEKSKTPNAYGFLVKPVNQDLLYSTIELAISRYEAEKALAEKEEQLARANEELERANEELIRSNEELRHSNDELEQTNDELEESQIYLEQSKEKYKKLIHTIPYGIAEIDTDGIYSFVSDPIYEIVGYEKGELIGKSIYDLMPAEDKAELNEFLKYAIKERPKPETHYNTNVRKDGELIRVQVDWDYKLDENDNVIGFYTIITDITEKQKAEERMKKNNAFLNAIYDNIEIGIFVVDVIDEQDFILAGSNSMHEKLIGIPRSDTSGKPVDHLKKYMDENTVEGIKKLYKSCVDKKEKIIEEKDAYINGELTHWYTTLTPLIDADGKIYQLVGTSNEISKIKLNETKLKETERFLDEMSKVGKIGGWEVAAKTNTVKWTKETYAIYNVGFDFEPTIENVMSFYRKDHQEIINSAFIQTLETGEPFDEEIAFITATGKEIWVRIKGEPVYENGEMTKVAGILQDITRQKEIKESLKEREKEIRTLFEIIPNGIVYTNATGEQLLFCNDGLTKLIDYSKDEIIGKSIYEFMPNQYSAERVKNAMKSIVENRPEPVRHFHSLFNKNGDELYVQVDWDYRFDDDGNIVGFIMIFSDITEQKRAEEALKDSEELFRGLFEGSRDGIALVDGQNKFVDCNQSFLDMLGYTMEELRSMTFYDITPTHWHGWNSEMVDRFLTNKLDETYEKEYIKKDGTVFPVEISLNNIDGKHKNGAVFWGVVRDITRRKKTEKRLREERNRFRKLLADAPVAIGIYNTDEEMVLINNVLTDLLGYTLEDIPDLQTWWETVHPDVEERNAVRNAWLKIIEEAIRLKRGAEAIIANVTCKDGSVKVIKSRPAIIDNEFVVIFSDLTAQKEAEEQLKNINKELEERVNARTKELVETKDSLMATNEEFESSNEELEATNRELEKINQEVEQTNRRLETLNEEFEATNEELEATNEELEATNEELEATNRELSQALNQLEISNNELEIQRQKADKANKMKSDFISMISHELRTPLNSIINFTDLLLKGAYDQDKNGENVELNNKQRTKLGNVLHSSCYLLEIINDLLDLNKLLANKMELHFEEFNLHELLRSVCDVVSDTFLRNKNIDCKMNCDGLLTIYSDKNRIKQVLLNVLSNAAKYTNEGEVNTDVSVEGDNIKITITDTGIGIKEKDLAKIFDEFTQIESKETWKYKSTGLGLPIVVKLLKILGGSIDVSSEYGKGSVFTVIIPRKYTYTS